MRRLHYLATAAAVLGAFVAWWMWGSGEYGYELLWWPIGLAAIVYLIPVVGPFLMPDAFLLDWLSSGKKKRDS
jgi:hypothetical protein